MWFVSLNGFKTLIDHFMNLSFCHYEKDQCCHLLVESLHFSNILLKRKSSRFLF